MYFEIEGKSYRHYPDGRELGYSRFYQMLRSGIMAKTSQINSSVYLHCFEPVLKRGRISSTYLSLRIERHLSILSNGRKGVNGKVS